MPAAVGSWRKSPHPVDRWEIVPSTGLMLLAIIGRRIVAPRGRYGSA
jgi:hypothetical protein